MKKMQQQHNKHRKSNPFAEIHHQTPDNHDSYQFNQKAQKFKSSKTTNGFTRCMNWLVESWKYLIKTLFNIAVNIGKTFHFHNFMTPENRDSLILINSIQPIIQN